MRSILRLISVRMLASLLKPDRGSQAERHAVDLGEQRSVTVGMDEGEYVKLEIINVGKSCR